MYQLQKWFSILKVHTANFINFFHSLFQKRGKHEAINNGWPCIGNSEEECDLPDGPCQANENWLIGESRRAYRTTFTDKSESSSIGQDCAVLGWTKCEGQDGQTCGTGIQVSTLTKKFTGTFINFQFILRAVHSSNMRFSHYQRPIKQFLHYKIFKGHDYLREPVY